MTKSTYPTKYQLEHLKKRINQEIDPLIDQARLSVKSIIADLTEGAELKLAKKIKADVVIKELEKAIQELEIFECGVPEQLNVVLEKVLSGVGIVWNKTKALQIENKGYN